MTKKYVLTEKAKEYIRSVVKSPERAEEIIKKTEICFNNDQSTVNFSLGDFRVDGMCIGSSYLFLARVQSTIEVEDWQLTDEEIDSIGAEEKIAA